MTARQRLRHKELRHKRSTAIDTFAAIGRAAHNVGTIFAAAVTTLAEALQRSTDFFTALGDTHLYAQSMGAQPEDTALIIRAEIIRARGLGIEVDWTHMRERIRTESVREGLHDE